MKRILLCLIAAIPATAFAQNTGIGTTSPTDQLHTTGTVRFEGYRGAGTRMMQIDSTGRLAVSPAGPVSTNNTAQSIPDNSCTGINSVITIAGQPAPVPSGKIAVRINIIHTYVGDLRIYLTAPTGQILCLKYSSGGNGLNYTNTIFTDAASTSIANAVSSDNPFTGSYTPAGVLTTICSVTPTIATFGAFGTGGTIVPNGAWTLRVIDAAASDVGQLLNWTISFSGAESIATADANNYIPYFAGASLAPSKLYNAPAGNTGLNTTTPHSSAALDVSSTTQGLLPPRMSYAQILAIPNPAPGLIAYDLTNNGLRVFNGNHWMLLGEASQSLTGGPGTFGAAAISGGATPRVVKFGPNKKVYVGGIISGTANFGGIPLSGAGKGLFIGVLDSNGAGIWAYSFGDPSPYYDEVRSMCVDTLTGNVFLAGTFYDVGNFNGTGTGSPATLTASGLNWQTFYVGYSATGSFLWASQTSGASIGTASDMKIDGGWLYIAGNFSGGTFNMNGSTATGQANNNNLYFAKVSTATGTANGSGWLRTITTGPQFSRPCAAINSAGPLLAGSCIGGVNFPSGISNNSSTYYSAYMQQFNFSGAAIHFQRFTGTGDINVGDVLTDTAQNFILMGDFAGTASFSPGTLYNRTSLGQADIFVVTLAPSASAGWNTQYASVYGSATGYETLIRGAYSRQSNDIYALCTFDNTLNIGAPLTTYGSTDLALVKFTGSGWIAQAGSASSDGGSDLAASADGKQVGCIVHFGAQKYRGFNGDVSAAASPLVIYKE